MRRLRVHPIQYLLVGSALAVFFLLLVSLSEHVPFAHRLPRRGRRVHGAARPSTARSSCAAAVPAPPFGAGIAALYGALYVLLQLEQTALLLGSIMLFAVLAALMVATRRIDWYGLFERMRAEAAEPRSARRRRRRGVRRDGAIARRAQTPKIFFSAYGATTSSWS